MADNQGPIEHIVVLMLENRSFDHMFGFLERPGLEPLEPGSFPNPLNLEAPGGPSYGVSSMGDYALPVDPPHSHHSVMTQLHCGSDRHCDDDPKMDGFVAAYFEKASGHEQVAEVRWWLMGLVLAVVAGGVCAGMYLLGDSWSGAAVLATASFLVPTLLLLGLRRIIERWWLLVLELLGGAIALLLLARSMRHEWWAASLVFVVLVGLIAFAIWTVAKRPLYVRAQDLAHAQKDAPLVMRCMPTDKIPALATLAKHFAVCTRWFASVPGATWPNRNFAHAGTSAGTTDIEFGFYRNRTIYEALSEAGRSWHIYHHGMAQVMAFPKLWRNHPENWFPMSAFRDHVVDGTLPNYSFIEPSHEGPDSNSQHPGNNFVPAIGGIYDFQRGEALIAQVYETLRAAPKLFERTLLLITYDEHGGLFDHVPPGTDAVPPNRSRMSPSRWVISLFVKWGGEGFDFTTLGVRVPAVVVSPRVRSMVDPTCYDHSSIVATVRAVFAPLSEPLTPRAGAANTFHGLAGAEPRADLPDLSPSVDPDASGLAAVEAAEVAAVTDPPEAHRLSSQLDRLDRGVRWRGRLRHPRTWSRPIDPDDLREAAVGGVSGPHAETVLRFMQQAKRARQG
jgi:hypothetical protein